MVARHFCRCPDHGLAKSKSCGTEVVDAANTCDGSAKSLRGRFLPLASSGSFGCNGAPSTSSTLRTSRASLLLLLGSKRASRSRHCLSRSTPARSAARQRQRSSACRSLCCRNRSVAFIDNSRSRTLARTAARHHLSRAFELRPPPADDVPGGCDDGACRAPTCWDCTSTERWPSSGAVRRTPLGYTSNGNSSRSDVSPSQGGAEWPRPAAGSCGDAVVNASVLPCSPLASFMASPLLMAVGHRSGAGRPSVNVVRSPTTRMVRSPSDKTKALSFCWPTNGGGSCSGRDRLARDSLRVADADDQASITTVPPGNGTMRHCKGDTVESPTTWMSQPSSVPTVKAAPAGIHRPAVCRTSTHSRGRSVPLQVPSARLLPKAVLQPATACSKALATSFRSFRQPASAAPLASGCVASSTPQRRCSRGLAAAPAAVGAAAAPRVKLAATASAASRNSESRCGLPYLAMVVAAASLLRQLT
mmetsp:Transcript_73712/g.146112  ORF Transcript_73712/g.146112 Transcript_73712/m.146112 type:complete len:475 (+) Transcript_73712:366-1790(+)